MQSVYHSTESHLHRQIEWPETIIAGSLILLPTSLCLFVKKSWILKYQRELLSCSLGTIFAIVFVDLIPELIEDAAKEEITPIKSKLFSLSIFGGIAFAFLMNALHDIVEYSQCDGCDKDDLCDNCKHNKEQNNTV